MNTTLQIRIDKKTKARAQKALKNMGLDLSSGIKYYLGQVAKTDSLSYICEFGYLHYYSKDAIKKLDKEISHELKDFKKTKKYKSAEEMHAAIMKEE